MKVSVYYCRLLNAVIIILIGVACDTFCTFFDHVIPGNTPHHYYSHKKSRRYVVNQLISILFMSTVIFVLFISYSQSASLDLLIITPYPIPSCSWWHSAPHQIVIAPVHRSGSLSIEYNTIWVYFVIVAEFLWLQNEMGLNHDIVECYSFVANEVCNCICA